jgi:uncharacterized protein
MIERVNEQKVLLGVLKENDSAFIAVTGRRRVGKTYLIEQTYASNTLLQLSGFKDFTNNQHLKLFANAITQAFPGITLVEKNDSWLNAFTNLISCLEVELKPDSPKRVIFFDELPWLAKPKSGMLAALSFFWNSWAKNKKIILVICGSAASWMIEKVINDKGGLYNRVTKLLHLKPFTLYETKLFLESRNVFYNNEQLIQVYMVMGGIPHYLKEMEGNKSALQNIQSICFSANGLLRYEFENLYDALFSNSKDHKSIIKALHKKKKGLTIIEISKETKLIPNGAFYAKIEELTLSGFIIEVQAYNAKSNWNVYRLIDEFTFFYLSFMSKINISADDYWYNLSSSAAFKVWTGYAFENICIRHINNIKKSLGISGIQTELGCYKQVSENGMKGAQIDLIISRADNCVNLIECKYYNNSFYLQTAEVNKIKERKAHLMRVVKNKKQIFVTLISPHAMIPSKESLGLVDIILDAEAIVLV